VGQLYDMCKRVRDRIEAEHGQDPMALIRIKGELATRTGFLVSMVGPSEPDDSDKIERLKAAAAALGIPA
jgi:hypothetical protein